MISLPFAYDDGGRAAAGYRGNTRDCVCRAIAIATQIPYQEVYDELALLAKAERSRYGRKRSSPRLGVARRTFEQFLLARKWTWTPTMQIGSGCKIHLRPGELPPGRLIVAVSHHVVAVIDGVVHDTYDPCRSGTRCVYGYWRKT
jgi:hypothetical protein